MRIADYTKKEIDYLLQWCNFTDDEMQFFILRSKDKSIEVCADVMSISISTANVLSKKIKSKINRVLT